MAIEFLNAFPAELEAIMEAWNNKQQDRIRATAHTMRTTISVMGLNAAMGVWLDELEYGALTQSEFMKNYEALQRFGNRAVEEARIFLADLSRYPEKQ